MTVPPEDAFVDEQTAPAPRTEPPPVPGRLLDQLEALIRTIEAARAVPLSSNVMINQEEILGRLEGLRNELPEELRAARWMVREREAYIARTNEKARSVVERAKARSDELISESYIMNEAVEEANTLVRNAEAEARRIRLEAEDFADQHLAEADTLLGELLLEIRAARSELLQARPAPPDPPVSR